MGTCFLCFFQQILWQNESHFLQHRKALLFTGFILKPIERHSVHWGINPSPQKHQPIFFCQAPPLNLQTVQDLP